MEALTKKGKAQKNGLEHYRFAFNGQEKVNEINGIGNHNTALFWEYDTRLGRRWNLDPKPQIRISDYAAFKNNPITHVDILGDKVVNGDKMKADEWGRNVEYWKKRKSDYESENGIRPEMSKKDFLKNGGSKEVWSQYKSIKKDLKTSTSTFNYWNNKSALTEYKIELWKKTSPNIFNEVDKKEVDFILMSKSNMIQNGIYGNNSILMSSDYQIHPAGFDMYEKQAQVVNIDDGVKVTEKDSETGQYSLNHEAGHFLYMVNHPAEYFLYLRTLDKQGRSLNGGHNKDDLSGQQAEKYGQIKDTP